MVCKDFVAEAKKKLPFNALCVSAWRPPVYFSLFPLNVLPQMLQWNFHWQSDPGGHIHGAQPCECQKNDDHAPGWASYLMHRLQAWTQQTLSLKPAFWSVGNSRRLSSHRSWWWISTWKPGQIDTEGGIFYLPKFETQGEIGLKKTSQELFKNASCVRSSPEVHKKTILSERWAQFKYDE